MKELSRILKAPLESGVYVLAQPSDAGDVQRIASESGFAFFHVRGHDVCTKDQFLNETAKAFKFPAYFGHNWDALEDCLTDMSWVEADGFLMLFDTFNSFAEHSPDDFATALDILSASCQFWSEHGKALVVLLHGMPHEGAAFPEVRLSTNIPAEKPHNES